MDGYESPHSLSSAKAEELGLPSEDDRDYLIPLKTWRHHGRRSAFIFTYRTNSHKYIDDSSYRHRDFASRVEVMKRHDAHLDIRTGKLCRLIVQCTDDFFRFDRCGGFDSSLLNFGKYPPVPHTYWGDAKVWSNLLENSRELSQLARNTSLYRPLKPRNLCLLTSNGYNFIDVGQWERESGNSARALSYLFVAYSSDHFDDGVDEDMKELHDIGMTAAREAGVAAFWVAASCMRDPAELENDVYRISDVLRGARKMIIAVGPSKSTTAATLTSSLQQWGSRMWTFPEVLLSPNREISVYRRGGGPREPETIPKNQAASKLWPRDAAISRQLVDHYLGTINLSRIELAVLALKCLYARETTEYAKGDHAYALMGLLRIRPPIDKTDSQFQAFASDKLLERYICTLPREPNQPWHDMTDAYGSSLWDIDPACQVAAICDDDTVVLDGARGATIEWSRFDCIWYTTGASWKRLIASCLMRFGWALLFFGILFVGIGLATYDQATRQIYLGLGVFLFIIWFATVLVNPLLVRIVLAGKIQDIQGAFYGAEGYLNPATVERLIFGGNFGRFKWSSHGSLLNRSQINEHKERVGIDPCGRVDTREKVEAAKKAKPGDMRIFTLVDTYNLEVTIFEAARPPNVLLFCGSEVGKQRAVGCSYDWTTQTFYRETVLRVPTESLERASRVSRFRMGIQRPSWETVPGHSQKKTVGIWNDLNASLLDEMRYKIRVGKSTVPETAEQGGSIGEEVVSRLITCYP
ncbi:hypothetical protein LA080_009474 [Diaporthe eres]|nr:hypothetical protein LA080_009474 [Diaporthe eres]